MPRQPRSLLQDGVFHVTSRGVEHRAIFVDDTDRRAFLRLVLDVTASQRWTVHALCLMTTHYHLVLEATRENLSLGLHRLNGIYAQAFNIKHKRWGHLFGDRFSCQAIEDEHHLHAICRYVALNPVKAGLCERAEDWPWTHSRYPIEDGDLDAQSA